MARMRDRYIEEVAPNLKERFGIENPMRMPGLEKIVVNMGVGEAVVNSRALDGAMEDLARITGQKAQLRRARKSIAGSMIGGIAETQEVIDYCAARNIKADIELVRPDQINEAFERVVKKDVRYRFVIDMTQPK